MYVHPQSGAIHVDYEFDFGSLGKKSDSISFYPQDEETMFYTLRQMYRSELKSREKPEENKAVKREDAPFMRGKSLEEYRKIKKTT